MSCLLFDVEGTITALAFVRDELFPYARAALPAFVAERAAQPVVRSILDRLAQELRTGDHAAITQTLVAWIDEDRKHPDLKALQGMIWEAGYTAGAYRGHLYPDVVPFWERARGAGWQLAIYSSGSVLAQRLLLTHSIAGDVAHLIDRHFDTAVGTKAEPDSYRHIAAALGLPAGDIWFFSDVVAELDAARAAGCRTTRVVRPGVPPQPHRHPEIPDFASLTLDAERPRAPGP